MSNNSTGYNSHNDPDQLSPIDEAAAARDRIWNEDGPPMQVFDTDAAAAQARAKHKAEVAALLAQFPDEDDEE